MAMDSGTISAVVALIVAGIALLVAFAQVIQQYIGTAASIRKCDSTVYGLLPGSGRRVWIWRQMRFKVYYSAPRFSLTAELWPELYRPSFIDPGYPISDVPPLDCLNPVTLEPEPGQASWAIFYRMVQKSCYKDFCYQMHAGDADLCPSDLPVIPTQMSLRDIIVMAFMNGMSVTYTSGAPTKVLSMQGPPGSLNTAEHSILGTIIHFTPHRIVGNYGVTLNGQISTGWMHRLVGDCPVAKKDFTPSERDHIEYSEGIWMRRLIQKVAPNVFDSTSMPPPAPTPTAYFNPFIPKDRPKGFPADDVEFSGRYVDKTEAERFSPYAYGRAVIQDVDPMSERFSRGTESRGALSSPGINHTRLISGGDASRDGTLGASNASLIPWRRPWSIEPPREASDLSMVPSAYSKYPMNSHSGTSAPAGLSFVPDAPQPPNVGVYDGKWEFSTDANNQVIFIFPGKPEIPRQSRTENSWVLWLHKYFLDKKEQMEEEKEPILPIFHCTAITGWRMAKGRRITQRLLPLPETDDSSLSAFSDDSLAVSSSPLFPPDFLNSNLQLDSGRGCQSPIRVYRAISQQTQRRLLKEEESRDRLLLKDRPDVERRVARTLHAHTESAPASSALRASIDRRNVSPPPGPVGWRPAPRKRITQGPRIRMIEAPEFDYKNRSTRPTSHKSLAAFVESDSSDDEKVRSEVSEASDNDEHFGISSSSDSSDSQTSDDWRESHSPSRPPYDRRSKRPAGRTQPVIMRVDSEEDSDALGQKIRVSRARASEKSRSETSTYRPKRVSFAKSKINTGRRDSATGRIGEDSDRYFSSASEYGDVVYDELDFASSDDERSKEYDEYLEQYLELSRRERMRDREQYLREERRRRRIERPEVLIRRYPGDITWFWVCQINITPGYWATPWTHQFDPYVSIGIMAVILEALVGLTDDSSLQYSSEHQEGVWTWLRDGKSTFPPYARNSRGGVIVSGSYEAVSFNAFEENMPPIKLLHDYDYQVSKSPGMDDVSVLGRQLELMAMDSWLSAAGRSTEIKDGPANLLRTTPALITKIMREFGYDFKYLELNANEGGLQIIRGHVEELIDALEEEGLTEAEQLFILVSLLRTAKVSLCISLGLNTDQVVSYLAADIQVFMV